MLDCQIDYQNAQFKLQLQLACAEQIVGILGPPALVKPAFCICWLDCYGRNRAGLC